MICESFLNEDSCLYKYPTGKEDKMCLYLEGKCKEINKDFPCSILDRTNCEDRFNYVCYYDRETFKCRDYACKERDCQSTKAASYPKKDGENYLCKFDPEKQECGDADI